MTRTEQDLRAAERSGEPIPLLRARLRAGLVTRDRLNLAAWLGDDDALDVLGEECSGVWIKAESGESYYTMPQGSCFNDWAAGILPLMDDLGDRVPGKPCLGDGMTSCAGDELVTRHERCKGSGLLSRSSSWSQWLCVRGMLAVGRAVYDSNPLVDGMAIWAGMGKNSPRYRVLTVFEATRAWAENPSDENIKRVRILVNQNLGRPDWAYQPLRMAYQWDGAARAGVRMTLNSASAILENSETRALFRDAVVPLVLA